MILYSIDIVISGSVVGNKYKYLHLKQNQNIFHFFSKFKMLLKILLLTYSSSAFRVSVEDANSFLKRAKRTSESYGLEGKDGLMILEGLK